MVAYLKAKFDAARETLASLDEEESKKYSSCFSYSKRRAKSAGGAA